jgi:hypothetical protein
MANIDAPHIASTTVLYAPMVRYASIVVGYIEAATALYEPTMRRASIPVPVCISDTHLFPVRIARPLVNISLPAISGTPQVGQMLEASPGVWSGDEPISLAYQWQRCNAAGGSCVDISGETAATYIVRAADVGNTIRVQVTARDGS